MECAAHGGSELGSSINGSTLESEQVDLNGKAPTCGAFAETSDGLEPVDPLLTMEVLYAAIGGKRWQRFAMFWRVVA